MLLRYDDGARCKIQPRRSSGARWSTGLSEALVAGALSEGDDPTFEPHRTSRRSSTTTSSSLRAPGP